MSAAGAPRFTRLVISQLNHASMPYELKLSSHASRYDGGDGAVLYLNRSDVVAAWDVLPGILSELELLPTIPALTKPIAPGVGLAEDTGGGESFGMQRCRWLSEGIVRAWEIGQRSLADRMQVVAETWAEAGIAFEQPYLNPGSLDVSDLASPPLPTLCQSLPAPSDFLECATSIGHALVSSAIWHGERCTWLGLTEASSGTASFNAVPPTLYDGTAGVALFLAELNAAMPDATVRATALGALRQSLATADRAASPVGIGLYIGLPGIVWSVARVSHLLDEPELLDAARALLARLPDMIEQPHESDLLSGSAGAIVALLRLREWFTDPALLATAIRLGDYLIACAEIDGRGWRWRSTAHPRVLPLTGFSHGASGIAYAFVSLFVATNDVRYREAALGAFAWERGRYIANGNVWPDYRDVASAAVRRGATLPSAAFWCHGAPGIALTRLVGWKGLGDDRLRDEAIAALTATRQAVGQAIGDPADSLCLCHGLAGNALILQHGADVLDDSSLRDASRAAFASLIERHILADLESSPGLMTGLSGVGLACLRAAGYPATDVLSV